MFRGSRSGCESFQAMSFEPLPATASELDEVLSVWATRGGSSADPRRLSGARAPLIDVVRLDRAAASETEFKRSAPGEVCSALATHGFFLGENCRSAPGSAATEAVGADVIAGEPSLALGLVMAGANHREAAASDEDDGILTAEEIAALDLQGVEWALLSACKTGLGEVRTGEGVFGLRRAFALAGARSLIMSLWQVEDEPTREWMRLLN